MGEGTLIRYRLRLRGIPIRWLTRIEEWDPEPPVRRHPAQGARTASGTTPTTSSRTRAGR